MLLRLIGGPYEGETMMLPEAMHSRAWTTADARYERTEDHDKDGAVRFVYQGIPEPREDLCGGF